MCLVGPLRSKIEVMTHMVNLLFKKYTFLLALSLMILKFRKYISEKKNQMFSYMLIILVCIWVRVGLLVSKVNENVKIIQNALENGNNLALGSNS